MGGACCKSEVVEFNPDGQPKEPQTKEQRQQDGVDLRNAAKAADWAQMKVLLRRMPVADINAGATNSEVQPEDKGNTPLHFAVTTNWLKGVRKLVRYGHRVNTKNAAGRAPLALAVEAGKLQVASFLLSKGGDVNVQDGEGCSPFLSVVASGRRKLATWVLDECSRHNAAVDFDVVDKQGNTVMLYCAKYAWFDLLELWLERLKDAKRTLNTQNRDGETPLGWVLKCAAGGDLLDARTASRLTDKLLEAGALAVLPSFAEKVPLIHLAAATNLVEVYKAVLGAGADPLTQTDALGRSALHFAAAKGATATAELLLDAGSLQAADKQKNTPLHLAAMHGQEATAKLLLSKADNLEQVLLTPNKDGLTVYALALQAGNEEEAQNAALDMIERLQADRKFDTPVFVKEGVIKETPLLLAVGGHQDRVVKKLLELEVDVNQKNHKGESALARNLASCGTATYDSDAAIFDALVSAGAEVDDGADDHPLLAMCKMSLSNFAQRAVAVLDAKAGGKLDWDRRDSRGYSTLMLAAFHNNAWLVSHIMRKGKVDPNAENQRTQACAGTTGGQTPLMCAAKGASVEALKILLAHGADVHAVDDEGRTALAYAMTLDKPETLECARLLLAAGARTKLRQGTKDVQMLDITGESWVHRAVRYGFADFIRTWVAYGGCLEVLASTPDDADDMPGAELKAKNKHSFLDAAPTLPEDDELPPDEVVGDGGSDSEQEDNAPAGAGGKASEPGAADSDAVATGQAKGPAAVAEGVEDDECGDDCAVADLVKQGRAHSFYAGPSAKDRRRWTRNSEESWRQFWSSDVPPSDLEDEPGWEDQHTLCTAGEDEIDEEDIMDVIRDQQSRAASKALPRGGALSAIRTAQAAAAGGKPPLAPVDRRHHSTPGGHNPQEDAEGEGSERVSPLGAFAHRLLRQIRKGAVSETAALPSVAGPVAEGRMESALPVRRAHSQDMAAAFGVEGVVLPSRKSVFGGGSSSSGSAAAVLSFEAEVERIALEAARQMGLTDDQLRAYGITSPSQTLSLSGTISPGSNAYSAGPVAEGLEAVTSMVVSSKAWDLDKTIDAATSLATAVGGSNVKAWASDPYFHPDTRYQGMPRYMDESVHPWWPKVDCSDVLVGAAAEHVAFDGRKNGGSEVEAAKDCYPAWVRTRMERDGEVRPSKWYLEADDGPWNVDARLKAASKKRSAAAAAAAALAGPALRERNLRWYLNSMSPTEFPLKPGQWRSFVKKTKKAVEEARKRAPRQPGSKASVRSKTAWFGIPDLPSRPELNLTSPLVMAVRLGRVECVEQLVRLTDVNLPDGHGHTPLQYALLLLVKDRHNAEVQRIVDLLLAARPFVSSRAVVRAYLLPRARRQLAELASKCKEAEAAAGGRPAPKELRQQVERLQELVQRWEPSQFQARESPSVMDPLVLGVLMNDMPRVAWMVFKCGGDLNDAYVALPDIPIYFQGLWEGVAARCNSRVLPLHLGVLHKRFETVRLLLDMGADPNACGQEFTGNNRKDLLKRNKAFAEKVAQVAADAAQAATSNPYERLWHTRALGLMALVSKVKRFILSLDFSFRPHPHVSALHLAARLGNAPLLFLLVKRGAQLNGAGAAAFAPKSPLEEALQYARSNAQYYNTGAGRINHEHVRTAAYLDESDPNAQAEQMAKVQDYESKLSEKCGDKYSETLAKSEYRPNSLASFTADDLAKIAIPEMSPPARDAKSNELANQIMGAITGFSGGYQLALKAICMAAKAVVKFFMAMMRRPIAHEDPALYAAHVLLYHRAPLHVDEKQTTVVLRDMMDNGTYQWLDLDVDVVADDVWRQTAVNKLNVLKSNDEIGYKILDMTPDYRVYDKTKRKLLDAIDRQYFDTSIEALMPAYHMPKLLEHLSGGLDEDGRPLPLHSLTQMQDQVESLMADSLVSDVSAFMLKVLALAELGSRDAAAAADPEEVARRFGAVVLPSGAHRAWGREQWARITARAKALASELHERHPAAAKGPDGKLLPWVHGKALDLAKAEARDALPRELSDVPNAFVDVALQLAKAKLPSWYTELTAGQLVAREGLATWCKTIAATVAGFDPTQQKPREFAGFPDKNDEGVSTNPLDLMLQAPGVSLSFKKPSFPERSLKAKARRPEDLGIVDVVKAVQAAFVSAQAKTIQADLSRRAATFDGILAQYGRAAADCVVAATALRSELVKDAAQSLSSGQFLTGLSDTEVVAAAMIAVNFDVAACKLGPRGAAVMAALRTGLGDAATLEVSEVVLDAAKQVGAEGLRTGGAGALLQRITKAAPDLEFDPEFTAYLDCIAKGQPVRAPGAAAGGQQAAGGAGAKKGGKGDSSGKAAQVSAPAVESGDGDAEKAAGDEEERQRRDAADDREAVEELFAELEGKEDAEGEGGEEGEGKEEGKGALQSLLFGDGNEIDEAGEGEQLTPVKVLADATGLSELKDGEKLLTGEVSVEGFLAGLAGEWGGKALKQAYQRSQVGKEVQALDAELQADPVLAQHYARAKEQAAEAVKQELEPLLGSLADDSAPQDWVMGEGMPPGALEGALVDMRYDSVAAQQLNGHEVLEQAVLGLQLDADMDFGVLCEAMCDMRDALLNVLEVLDMDVV